MNQESAQSPRLFSHYANCGTVHQGCKFLLFLCFIDRRISSCIDNDGGLGIANDVGQIMRPREVAGQAIHGEYIANGAQAAPELPADLTVGSSEQDPHAKTSALSSGSPNLSLAESTGSPVNGQSMATFGSFQMR